MNLAITVALLALMAANTRSQDAKGLPSKCFMCNGDTGNESDSCNYPMLGKTETCVAGHACATHVYNNYKDDDIHYSVKRWCINEDTEYKCSDWILKGCCRTRRCYYCHGELCNNRTTYKNPDDCASTSTTSTTTTRCPTEGPKTCNAGTHSLSPWLFTAFISTITVNLMF